MFAGWGSWVARFRIPVLAVALVAVISAGVWGLGVFGELTEGGYNDPNSESTQAADLARDAFGAQGGDLVVIYTPTKGRIDDAGLGKRVRESLAKLPRSAVTGSSSYWSAKSAQYAAKDKSSAVAVITLAGAGDAAKLDAYREVDDRFAVQGATVQLSGATVIADASSTRSTSDLGTAEAISLPITLVLLVLIFGSLVAASLPVLVGGAAVLGSLGILHAISASHDVNSFAVNVASLLGLGMAIDYGLFMVGRFREEQAEGRTPAEAVARTVGTAGRTVVFSATLLMIALAGLLLFPQGFLKSLAYGGLAAVFLAAVLSLTLLPAMLAILGPRVDKIPVRLPRLSKSAPGTVWTRLAGFVLRRPLAVALPILAFLLLLAAPVRGAHFGESDERILPAGDAARVATETLKADYPQFTGDNVQIVLRNAADPAAFAVALRQIPGIDQIGPARKQKGVTLFTATLKTKDAYGSEARDVVDAIRALPVPSGAELLVGGTTARNVDSLDATAARLPWMILMLVGATLILMFLAFGSVLLPVKAVLMSALSLCATCGALVWIFQDGHGAGLLDITPAPLEVGIVVLMAAVVFGLSTDYEVFLLSRMVEARTRGASTSEAVTTGLARTGRVISAAAVLLIVVTGAFALSAVTTMRFVGVGMIIALLLDATVVRMLLVPAILRLVGDAAWWAPGPLRRLQQRAGLSEYASAPAPEVPAPGRHAIDETQVIRYAPYGASTHALPLGADSARALPARPARPLPAPSPAYALPAAPADDTSTQIFERIDDTAILTLPEAIFSTPDESTAHEPVVDAEIVEDDGPASGPPAVSDAFDVEEVPDDDTIPDTSWSLEPTPARVPWVSPPDLSTWLPARDTPVAPAPDWTVPDDDGFFFSPPPGAAAPFTPAVSSYDTRQPAPAPDADAVSHSASSSPSLSPLPSQDFETTPESGSGGEIDAPPQDPAADHETLVDHDHEGAAFPPLTSPTPSWAGSTEAAGSDTFSPSSTGDDDLHPDFGTEPVAAEAFTPFTPAPMVDETPAPIASAPAATEAFAPFMPGPAPLSDVFVPRKTDHAKPEPTPATSTESSESVPATSDDSPGFAPATSTSDLDPTSATGAESSEPAAAMGVGSAESGATAGLAARPPKRPATLADQPTGGRSATPTSGAANSAGFTQDPAGGLAEILSPRSTARDGQTPSRRPATLGDQPLPRRPIPSFPEPQPMTEPEQQPQASAEPTPAPAAEHTPATPPAPSVTPPPTTPPAEATPPAPPAQVTPPETTTVPAAATPPPPIVTPAPAAPPQPLAVPVSAALPQPFAPAAAPWSIAVPAVPAPAPAPARRPADLADHLRESRPADLSDYTSGRIPRMRRPVEEPPPAVRRPVTLADHLSARGSAEESTHDLRDHAAQE